MHKLAITLCVMSSFGHGAMAESPYPGGSLNTLSARPDLSVPIAAAIRGVGNPTLSGVWLVGKAGSFTISPRVPGPSDILCQAGPQRYTHKQRG